MFNLRKKKKRPPPQGGPDLAVLLAHLEGLATGLAEQMFAAAAGEIEHEPERFRLAVARMFENMAGVVCSKLRANGANTEAVETFVTMGASHVRLKFETKWKELSAAMPNVQMGRKTNGESGRFERISCLAVLQG